ncbi:MAG: pilus assembly protein PilM [Peptococcaceae bacterium]|nr:pilus assembly protein PilM [Peptococcaceae bacterium]
MKKHWLAVIRDHNLSIARVAAGRNHEMKVMFLSEYNSEGTGHTETGESFDLDFGGIKNWLQRQRVPLKQLKLAVSSFGLITRVIALPKMTNNDLEKLITDHIDQYFTFNVQNYIIDYRVLNKYWENEKPMINVLMAAFPRERMENVWSLCQYLGFEPMVVDLTADCLARLYSNLAEKVQGTRSPDSEPGTIPGDMAIVSLNGDKVEFVLLENGVFFLYSDMELDLRTVSADINQKISEQVHLTTKLEEDKVPFLRLEKEEVPLPQSGELLLQPRVQATFEGNLFAAGSEKITLNLSSYTDDVKLLSSQDDTTNLLQDNIEVGEKSEDKALSMTGIGFEDMQEIAPGDVSVPLDFTVREVRERLLNQLIGLEDQERGREDHDFAGNKEDDDFDFRLEDFYEDDDEDFFTSDKKITNFDIDPKADNSYFSLNELGFSQEPWKEIKDSNTYSVESVVDETENENFFAEEIEEVKASQPTSNEEFLHIVDEDVFMDLAKALPQLDFSIVQNQQDQQTGIPLLEMESVEEVPVSSHDVPGDNFEENFVEDNLLLLDEEKDDFKQAALLINHKKEEQEEFVLEDLFVPLENLDEELAITLTNQQMAKQEDLPEDSEEDGLYSLLQDFPEFTLEDIPELQLESLPELPLEGLPEISPEEMEQLGSNAVIHEESTSQGSEKREELIDLDRSLQNELKTVPPITIPIGIEEKSIFDNLDLNMGAGGLEKIEARLMDRDPKDELEDNLSPVLSTLSELLSFFAARHFGQTVHSVYLTGEFCNLPYLEDIFRENLGVNTVIGFPNGWKPRFEGNSKALAGEWQKYGSLYGLALRED